MQHAAPLEAPPRAFLPPEPTSISRPSSPSHLAQHHSPPTSRSGTNPFATPISSEPPTRSGSPTLAISSLTGVDFAELEGGSRPGSRESSPWRGSTTDAGRSLSRSKDPLVKRANRQRGVGGSGPLSILKSWVARWTEAEPVRGRAGGLADQGGVSEMGKTARSSDVARDRTGKVVASISTERAQMLLAFAMIALVGMNDSATGANLNSMQAFYGVSYDQISIVFLSNVAGYFTSCLSSSFITHSLGLRKALLVAASTLLLGCLILALAPPFGVFIASLALLGFGSGLFDACLTTVISHEEDGVLMSMMYAFFGVGAMISPLLIGGLLDRGISWNVYYYIPLSLSAFLGVISWPVFSTYKPPSDEVTTGTATTSDIPLSTIQTHTSTTSNRPSQPAAQEGEVISGRAVMSAGTRMKRALGLKVVWIGFLLIVLAFGTSDTLSAWMVSYVVEIRGAQEAASRYQLSGLWGGIAFGRVALAWLLGRRMSEKTFAVLLLGLASGCLGVVWAVKSVPVDACALVLVGFFFGPVTPQVLSTVSARIPPSLKSTVMSLTIGLGLIGSSVGPLVFGIVAGRGGLATLPAVLIGTSVISSAAWYMVPKNVRRED